MEDAAGTRQLVFTTRSYLDKGVVRDEQVLDEGCCGHQSNGDFQAESDGDCGGGGAGHTRTAHADIAAVAVAKEASSRPAARWASGTQARHTCPPGSEPWSTRPRGQTGELGNGGHRCARCAAGLLGGSLVAHNGRGSGLLAARDG